MPATNEALSWIGHRVDDVYGARVGKIEDVYLDSASGEPVWLLARLGRFGDDHALVPVDGAVAGAGHVWLPHERRMVRSAPAVEVPGASLTAELDLAASSHYGLDETRGATLAGREPSDVTASLGAERPVALL